MDGARFLIGTKIGKAFLLAAAVDVGTAYYQAAERERLENDGILRQDGLNKFWTTAKYTFWDNPKWVITTIADLTSEPE